MKKTLSAVVFILFANSFCFNKQVFGNIENAIISGIIPDGEELSSSFNGKSLDGWKLDVGTFSNPGQRGADGGGYLHIIAPGEGVTSYLTSPSSYHGNWTGAKNLSLSIWIGPGEYYTKRSGAVGDIILKNGSKTARYYFPQKPPTSSWRKIVIPLNSSTGWNLDSGTQSLAEVLKNVTEFQIRGEYIIGDTETGIDEIVITGLNSGEKEISEEIGNTRNSFSFHSSSFDNKSVDGWKLDAGTLSNPGQRGADGGGYLHVIAPGEGVTSYLTSPSSYHGNWTGAKNLSLSIWIGPGEYYTKRSGAVGDIILKNGSKIARYYFPQKPSTSTWRKIVIPLNSSTGWEFDAGTSSLSDVLKNITEFQIRAEYIIGDTETAIDEVSITNSNVPENQHKSETSSNKNSSSNQSSTTDKDTNSNTSSGQTTTSKSTISKGGSNSSTENSSSFDNKSVDGWKLDAGTLSNPGQRGADGGGYLHVVAPGEGITSYLTSPSSYHGNWTGSKNLSLSIWIGPGEYYTKRSGAVGDIILKNGSKIARYYFPQKPSTSTWRKITIPLNSSTGWELDAGTRSLSEVLENVTEFQIRAEYIIGDTETAIDEISLDGISNSGTSSSNGNAKPYSSPKTTSTKETSTISDAKELPINIIGSWSTFGSRNHRGRLNVWQNGNHFIVLVSWIDEEYNLWKTYKGEGDFEGRAMNFKVYPSSDNGTSHDQGYVYHYTISQDNEDIIGYYTLNGKRDFDINFHYKRVK